MKFWKLLSGTSVISSYIIGVLGLLIGIFSVSGTITVPVRIVIFFSALLVVAFVIAGVIVYNSNKLLQAEARYPVSSYRPDKQGLGYLYIHYSKSFRLNALVSIYILKDGISRRMGYGFESDFREDEYNEIKIVKIFDTYSEDYEAVKALNKHVLSEMYLLPTVYRDNIADIKETLEKEG